MIPYVPFDPVAIAVGPLQVHWYGITYLLGFASAWWLGRRRALQPGSTWKPLDVDDFLFYLMLGVILGGRIGYLLVYGREQVAEDWHYIYQIWRGGMSFHGGFVGVLLGALWFARKQKRQISDVFDFTAPLPGLGLFFGRIGNYINGELWGKPTDVPWAFNVPDHVFAGFSAGDEVLHPTMLYEAALEGAVLFAVLWWFSSKERPYMAVSGLFLLLYGLFRFYIEFYRVPDAHIGYLVADWVTMGQVLSTPMIIAGAVLLYLAYRPQANKEATT
jgi:phosphatidylglycerol:prolipoprotein diacylglycerol transferase